MTSTQPDNPGVLALPPLLYGIALATGLVIHRFAPMSILPLPFAFWLGVAFLAAGGLLSLWGLRTMRAGGTNVDTSKPATAVVTDGPFRLSRNPLYLSLTLLFIGLSLAVNSLPVLLALVPLLVVMHYGVIFHEERYMEGKFGDSYREYRARVRRWL